MKYYTQHPKYFEKNKDINPGIYSGNLDEYETVYRGKTEKMEFVEISEEEARKIMLDRIKGAEEIPGQNIMGASESFYDPYYLVREAIKDKGIDLTSLSTEAIYAILEVADFATEVFY